MAFDWLLVSRYALLVALCELIPVPLLDGWVANLLRRRLTHVQLAQAGVEAKGAEVRMLADAGAGGCMGIVWSLIVWPFKKVLRSVLFVLMLNKMVNVVSEVVHRAQLVHEAVQQEALPGDAVAVRAAMNRALARVDITVVDKRLLATLDVSRRSLWRAMASAWSRLRSEASRERRDVQVVSEDQEPLPAEPEGLSKQLTEVVRRPVLEAELLEAFREELGGV